MEIKFRITENQFKALSHFIPDPIAQIKNEMEVQADTCIETLVMDKIQAARKDSNVLTTDADDSVILSSIFDDPDYMSMAAREAADNDPI